MKFLTLLAFLIFASTSYGAKISELNSLTNAQMANDDVMVVVDTDATETKKITISELSLRWLTSTITSATVTTGLTYDNEAYAEFQEATGNGDNYVRLKAPATLAGDVVLTLPPTDGSNGECLQTDGSGVLTWTSCGGAVDSVFSRTGAVVAAASDYDADQIDNTPAGDIAATDVQAAINELDTEKINVSGGSMSGDLTLLNTGAIFFREATGNGSSAISFEAPASLSSDYAYTLPSSYGTNGHYLQTDGAGGLTWAAGGSGPTLGATQTWTGVNTFDNEVIVADQNVLSFEEWPSNGNNTFSIAAATNMASDVSMLLPPTAGSADECFKSNGTNFAWGDCVPVGYTWPASDGSNGQQLTTDGSGGLSWAAAGSGGGGGFSGGDFFDEYNAQSSNYTVLDTDFFLAGDSSGGSFTFTLPAGSTGQRLIFKKTDSSLNKIDIGSITDLDTEGESVTLVYTGSAWIVENKYIPSEWVTFTPGTNWSGAEGAWKRIGDSVVVKWSLDLTGTPSGNINIDIPSGLTMDSSVMLQENNFIANNWGWCTMQRAQNHIAFLAWIDSNTFMLRYQAVSGTDVISSNTSPSGPATWATGDHIWCTSQPLPISEWRD